MLLAWQRHERGILPERVAGFRAWMRVGRCVRKNEKALRILAPVTVKERDEQGEGAGACFQDGVRVRALADRAVA